MKPGEELTREELGKRMDELARRYAETHDEQVSRTVTTEPMPSGVLRFNYSLAPFSDVSTLKSLAVYGGCFEIGQSYR
jgi:hypothetical protein